ncbi:MAG: hypothetical protein JRI99_07050 [Deltaproteobacteria bacterium]|nr:hypothetical protein [Deltaproteobacteria bacterium]
MVYPPGDIKNDLVASRKKLGDEAVIVGNYDVFHLPCREETTVEEARAGIRTNINGPVDAVWPGCDLWPDIKPEDWFAMEEEARTYKVGPTPVIFGADGYAESAGNAVAEGIKMVGRLREHEAAKK